MKLKDTKAEKSFNYLWLSKRIYPYIKPFLPVIILGLAVGIPLGLTDGVISFSMKPYFDYVLNKQSITILNKEYGYGLLTIVIPVALILFAIFQGILRFFNSYITQWTSIKITNSIKYDLLKRLVYMDTSFFDENSSGIIINRYLYDPAIASNGIVDYIQTLVVSIFGSLSLIAVMFYSSVELTLIGIIGLCTAFLPAFFIRRNIKNVSNEYAVINGKIMTTMNETYIGNKVVSTYELQSRQIDSFRAQIENSFKILISLAKKVSWISPLMFLISAIIIAFILYYGTHLIFEGKMTQGAFVAFITSLLMLYKPVRTMGQILTNVQNVFVAMGRIFELFDYYPEINDIENPVELAELKNSIKFNNVSFEYIKGQEVLKTVNLEVKKGETVAIVGASGCGKSTLANLLPRLYDVKSGSILIDDINIKNIKLSSLRKLVSIVFQDNFLFTGTIKENILISNPNATEIELENVINASNLKDFISFLPNGIDTVIGERGVTLSGGQRQRIAIARAMIRNSQIIVLDEATSSLDNESELTVQKALDNLITNKTVITIAHRLSTIKNADRIIVLNNGQIVEQGTHDELLKIQNGNYKNLYDIQFINNNGE